MAERVGFEPTVPCGTHAFQACALSHSAISPRCPLLLNLTQAAGLIALLGKGRAAPDRLKPWGWSRGFTPQVELWRRAAARHRSRSPPHTAIHERSFAPCWL